MSRNAPIPEPSAPLDPVASFKDVELHGDRSGAKPKRLTFTINQSPILLIVGPSGIGKSKIVDLLTFNGVPVRGELNVLGVDPSHISASQLPLVRRRVGIIFQDERLLEDLNVFENLAFAARAADRPRRDYEKDIAELLGWVGLRGKGAETLGRLTKGERRRVCLARALVNRPQLMVADDPTAGLSDRDKTGLIRLLRDVNGAGTPVVVTARDREVGSSLGAIVLDLLATIAT